MYTVVKMLKDEVNIYKNNFFVRSYENNYI